MLKRGREQRLLRVIRVGYPLRDPLPVYPVNGHHSTGSIGPVRAMSGHQMLAGPHQKS